jgi:hypothetical protein
LNVGKINQPNSVLGEIAEQYFDFFVMRCWENFTVINYNISGQGKTFDDIFVVDRSSLSSTGQAPEANDNELP